MIRTFDELTETDRNKAGGKGGTLAKLYQSKYPVPDGFVILPEAFSGDDLKPAAWVQVKDQLSDMRRSNHQAAFAVRSSALSEDSAFASFAGEFETVLDVNTDEMVREAIHTVRRSRDSERVKAYTQAKGVETNQVDGGHEIAVVVQRLVRADISGVLFTADPVSGSRNEMTGNYVYGFGEELVSGEAEPYTFKFTRPKGEYQGHQELRAIARQLYKLALRLEKELQNPQDIEWAVADGEIFLLQSRPITTLQGFDLSTFEWNSSFTGDYLWVEMGGLFPEVITPSTWSVWGIMYSVEFDNIIMVGNICGRLYGNYSAMFTMLSKLKKKPAEIRDSLALVLNPIPEDMDIPTVEFSLLSMLKQGSLKGLLKQNRLKRNFDQTIREIQEQCLRLEGQIRNTTEKNALIAIWEESLLPQLDDAYMLLDGTNDDYIYPYTAMVNQLKEKVGEERANTLFATHSGGTSELATIRPLVDIARVAQGEMSREAYISAYGHRTANENELAEPRPRENPAWVEKLVAEYQSSPVDVEALLNKRRVEFETIWKDLERDYPRFAPKFRQKMDRFEMVVQKREDVRSELTRTLTLIREWYLRAGELTGLGEDIFFLAYQEVLDLLAGVDKAVEYIPVRREVYEKYSALPTYPPVIRGRFDPVQWAADPNRRSDYYDPTAKFHTIEDPSLIKGYAGSAGRVEGIVHRIENPDEGHLLQPGEILLAVTTNVGWTPLFPKAGAVITDIGAPLAHAAIVARELGIPAVVGCGDATMRLKTGDRVRVDGGLGIVKIIE
jgi:phosphohistidine swiveling domain-containing protein